MVPKPNLDQVEFYDAEDFKGKSYEYKIGDDVAFNYPEDLNDKFKSLVTAENAKVLAWQHTNSTGKYAEFEGEVPNLRVLDGLSRFKVIESTTSVIAFRFDDKTGGSPKAYALQLVAAQVGNTTLYSNFKEDGDSADGFRLVGFMPEDGPPVTTALYVRDLKTGVYLASGSVFFKWDKETKQVDIVSSENFPKQLKATRSSANKFIIELISNKPSE